MESYKLFLQDIVSYVENASKSLPLSLTNLDVLALSAKLNKYLQTRIGSYGFDPDFHFRITLSVNSARDVRVNLLPLTLEGCDICVALGIPLDESLKKSLRKIHNETVHNQLLKDKPSDT